MSNPARAPKVSSAGQVLLNVHDTDAFFPNPEGARMLIRGNKTLETAQRKLKILDMDLRPTFRIPMHYTCDKNILENGGGMARAATGGLTFRRRTSYGKAFADAGFGGLPPQGPHGQVQVRERMKDTFLVEFGAEGTLGRLEKAYPRETDSPPPRPITLDEARVALRHAGWDANESPPAALPLNKTTDDGRAVTVNPNSDNGFPVLSKWKDPDAASMCTSLALQVRKELERGAKTPWEWVRGMEESNPELVACRGKGKADYYRSAKISAAQGRFYNVLPRQMMLIMQQATQPFEQACRGITLDGSSRTASGVTLVRGGAAELVQALEKQLVEHDYAYVHMGDDSWVALRYGDEIVMFALDCTSFDLTQHSTVSAQVHRVIRDELARIDPISAGVWYAYARERVVVVNTTLGRRFKHA